MKALSEAQIERIKDLTEDIIEKDGFAVHHAGLLKKLKAVGAVVDMENQRARIPRELLRELLETVPKKYTIEDMEGKEYIVGEDYAHTSAIVTDPWIIDYETGRPRRPCLEDVKKHTAIGQKFDHVVTMSRMDFPVTDCADETSSSRALYTHLMYQNKHITFLPGSWEHYKEWIDIVKLLTKGRDLAKTNLFTVAIAVVSPFILGNWNAELLLDACENNFKLVPTICPMSGTTSPYNKAASILQGNVENIFLAAAIQAVKPGTAYRYGFGISATDMMTGHDMYYTLDVNHYKTASVQLGKSYGMPTSASISGTMTYRYDVQNGAEGMLYMLYGCASGANILGSFGSCYNAIGMSAEMMVLQSAWFEAAKHLIKGIDFSDFEEGAESIRSVGPGGNFLTEDLTIKNLRTKEFFMNDVFDMSGGNYQGKSMLEKAHGKVLEMTDDIRSPLDSGTREALTKYFYDKFKIK